MDCRTRLIQAIDALSARRAAVNGGQPKPRQIAEADAALERMRRDAGIRPKRRRAAREEPEVVDAEVVRWMREQGIVRVTAWYGMAFGDWDDPAEGRGMARLDRSRQA